MFPRSRAGEISSGLGSPPWVRGCFPAIAMNQTRRMALTERSMFSQASTSLNPCRLQNVSKTRVECEGLARTEADNQKLVNRWNSNP